MWCWKRDLTTGARWRFFSSAYVQISSFICLSATKSSAAITSASLHQILPNFTFYLKTEIRIKLRLLKRLTANKSFFKQFFWVFLVETINDVWDPVISTSTSAPALPDNLRFCRKRRTQRNSYLRNDGSPFGKRNFGQNSRRVNSIDERSTTHYSMQAKYICWAYRHKGGSSTNVDTETMESTKFGYLCSPCYPAWWLTDPDLMPLRIPFYEQKTQHNPVLRCLRVLWPKERPHGPVLRRCPQFERRSDSKQVDFGH